MAAHGLLFAFLNATKNLTHTARSVFALLIGWRTLVFAAIRFATNRDLARLADA